MNDTHPTPPPPERRRFLKWVTHGLGALFGAVIGVPAVLYLIDPRNRKARAAGFRRVGKLSDLKEGVPSQAVLRDTRHDAWTVHPNDIVGRVWLVRRNADPKDPKVDAYTTICPHLGCSINYDEGQKLFICPCHNGTFTLECRKTEFVAGSNSVKNPAPRDMDSLEVQLDKDPDSPADRPDYFIAVKYENFAQGHEQKEVKK